MKRLLASALLMILLAGASLVALGLEFPLVIEGDHELAAVDGIRGNGTPDDPYVLEGLSATAGSATPFLTLRYIDAHLIIRDSSFSNAIGAAIALKACRNISIYACVFSDNEIAIDYDPGCMDISILLNSFLRNQHDLAATTYFVQLNDGYVGNYWDKYTGEDSTGDGIGEEPMILTDWQTPLVDERPLIYPYAGDRSMDPEGVRIEVKYTPGESISRRTLMTASVQFKRGEGGEDVEFILARDAELQMDIETYDRYGLYRINAATVRQSQEILLIQGYTELDMESDAQTPYLGYPFGASIVGPLQADSPPDFQTGEFSPLLLPVRPIEVGHTWTVEHPLDDSLDAEIYGVETTVRGSHTLAEIAEYQGIPCAIIRWQYEVRYDFAESPYPEDYQLDMLSIMRWEGTYWLSLASGQVARSITFTDFKTEIRTDGEITSENAMSALLIVEAP